MITCIVLAGGSSSRFGSPKPLAKIDGYTVLEILQQKLSSTGIAEILVVLGYKAEELIPFIHKDPRFKYVINGNYSLGQTSSFKTGLKAVNSKSTGIMLLPIDMPSMSIKTINGLINLFIEKTPLIILPTHQGRNGHPPIFSIHLKKELLDLGDNEPISIMLQRYKNETLKIEVPDIGITLSFNTPEELKRIALPKE